MIALSTGSLYNYGLARTFALAKEAGFTGVEVIVDPRWDTRQADYLKRLIEQFDLPILSVHNSFTPGVTGWPHDAISSCKESVKLAEAVGARVVVLHLPVRLARIELHLRALRQQPFIFFYPWPVERSYLSWLHDGLEQFQATTGVTIALENLPYRYPLLGLFKSVYHMNTPDEWATFPHWVMDTTHLGTGGFDILVIYERLKTRLAHVHLSNYNGKEHQLLTDGCLPLAELLRRLKRDRYQGIIVCELDPEPLGASDESVVRANLRATYEFCREHFMEG